jgi:hypothetical protein
MSNIATEFVAVLRTIERCRLQGWGRVASICYAAGHHRVSIQTAMNLNEQHEMSELERLALLAESQNLSALLRRQGE